MNYEFDPTLTGGAQNSYAEGMAEPGRGAETNQNADAEAEEAAKAKAAEGDAGKASRKDISDEQRETQKTYTKEELRKKRQDRELQEQLEGIAEMRAAGKVDPEKLDELERLVRAPKLQEPLTNLAGIIKNSNTDPRTRDEAYAKVISIAQELTSLGLATPAMKRIAESKGTSSQQEILDNIDDIFNLRRKAQDELDLSPGAMPRSSEQLEQYMDMYYPPSLEDVAEKAIDLESEEWRRGGKHEIVDAEGNVKLWNFRRWMEEKWLHWGHQLSPDDPQQQPWNSVAVLSVYTQIDLMRLLTTSRYWRKKVIDHYETTADGQKVPVYDYKKSPEYENLRADLLDQFWLFGKAHEFDASVRPLKGSEKQYLEGIAQLYGKNVWLQGRDRLTKAWKKDATSGSESQLKGEYDAWMKEAGTGGPQKEGRAGRAHRQADALYFRMAHLEKWNDGKEDYIARMKRNYNYSDNKFYEILGEEGVKAFYSSFITRGMGGFKSEYSDSLKKIDAISDATDLQGMDITTVMTNPNSITENLTSTGNKLKVERYFKKEIMEEMIRERYKDKTKGERDGLIARDLGDLSQWSINTIDTLINRLPEEQQREIEKRVQQKVTDLKDNVAEEIEGVRESILNKLTGWDSAGRRLDNSGFAGFKDTGGSHVRDLFARAAKEPMALEELGLRFASLQIGDKTKSAAWEKESTRKSAWKDTKKELNLFNAQSKPRILDDAVRKAIRDAIGAVNGIDDFDAEYAENFAFAKVYFTFTSGYNDTSATGFDAATKLMRFMDYRKNNMFGRKNYVGNVQNLTGVKRLLLTLWEGAYGSVENADGSRKKASLLSVMENGFTESTRGKGLQQVDFDRYKESTFGSNHIMSAFSIYERILKGPVFSFDKYIKIDNYGNVQTSPEAFSDILNQVNKGIRYTYNQLGLDFEDMEDEVEIVWEKDADGKMSPTPVFNKRKLKDALFAQEVVNMGMYEQREFIGNWINKKIGMKDTNGEDMLTEYSRNVMAYFIAKEILEHRLYNPKDSSYNYNIWELDMIRAIEGLFANMPGGEFEELDIGLFNKNKKLRKTGSFFNRKEFKKIRLMGNAGYGKLWLEELRAQMAESAWKGSTGTPNKFFSYIFQDMWSFK